MGFDPGSLIPVFGGLFDDAPGMYQDAANQYLEDLQKTQLPSYVFNEYVPESYKAELVSEDPTTRLKQMALLEKMGNAAETGFTDSDKAAYDLATKTANQSARQRNEALLNEAARRGIGGSGIELGLREQANQSALDRANTENLQRASDSARMMAAYQNAYGQQLGNVRGQDYDTQRANTNTINEFNRLNTSERNQAQKYNQEGAYGRQRDKYGDQMNMAKAQYGARTGAAGAQDMYDKAAGGVRGRIEDLGSAAAGAWLTPKKKMDYEE